MVISLSKLNFDNIFCKINAGSIALIFKLKVLIKLICSLCYYKSNNYEFCISHLLSVISNEKYKSSPYIYFLLSLCNLFQAQNRKVFNKQEKYIYAKKYFSLYKIKRNYQCPIEVLYNEGRLFHYLGLYNLAWDRYQDIYDKIDEIKYLNKETKDKIKSSTVYNMHLILCKGGDDKKAQELLHNNLKI